MEQTESNRWSVGCDSADEPECMGYQSFTTFARRDDAAKAWNTRAFSTPTILHDSDCAKHNMPAYPNGPCDCRADTILAVRLDEAAIRADEREKCLNQVCESLFVLADGWKEQPGKEETATAVSNAAVFICGKERAIAIRNGGKQP